MVTVWPVAMNPNGPFQAYPEPPSPERITFSFRQSVGVDTVATGTGNAHRFTVAVATLVQLLADPVMVYTWGARGLAVTLVPLITLSPAEGFQLKLVEVPYAVR